MRSKSGAGWKAAQGDAGRYFGEYGGCQDYHLYELTQEQFDRLEKGMTEGEAASVMRDGRHLYMSVNDRCGPPYTVVFDDDYAALWRHFIEAFGEVRDTLLQGDVFNAYAEVKRIEDVPHIRLFLRLLKIYLCILLDRLRAHGSNIVLD